MKLLAVAVALLASGCTYEVGQPQIEIQCVEIIFPTEHVLYCDGGVVPTAPPPSDGGPG